MIRRLVKKICNWWAEEKKKVRQESCFHQWRQIHLHGQCGGTIYREDICTRCDKWRCLRKDGVYGRWEPYDLN